MRRGNAGPFWCRPPHPRCSDDVRVVGKNQSVTASVAGKMPLYPFLVATLAALSFFFSFPLSFPSLCLHIVNIQGRNRKERRTDKNHPRWFGCVATVSVPVCPTRNCCFPSLNYFLSPDTLENDEKANVGCFSFGPSHDATDRVCAERRLVVCEMLLCMSYCR